MFKIASAAEQTNFFASLRRPIDLIYQSKLCPFDVINIIKHIYGYSKLQRSNSYQLTDFPLHLLLLLLVTRVQIGSSCNQMFAETFWIIANSFR